MLSFVSSLSRTYIKLERNETKRVIRKNRFNFCLLFPLSLPSHRNSLPLACLCRKIKWKKKWRRKHFFFSKRMEMSSVEIATMYIFVLCHYPHTAVAALKRYFSRGERGKMFFTLHYTHSSGISSSSIEREKIALIASKNFYPLHKYGIYTPTHRKWRCWIIAIEWGFCESEHCTGL